MAPVPVDIRRLAVVCPSWVGDTVMCTPVLRACRQARPAARISAIVRPGIDQLLAGCTFIDSTIVCDMKGLFGPQRLAKAIKQSDAQAVLLLPNSFRSAMGARLSGAPVRIGYDRDGRRALLTDALAPGPHDRPVPMIDYYLRLAQFALAADSIDPRMTLATTTEEEAAADHLLSDVAEPFIVINPGANRADKRWPAERFARMIDLLRRCALNTQAVVLTGSPAESDIIGEIQNRVGENVISLAERGITLASLKAVLRRASLLITNDTGPRHIAAAVGTPVVALFGPTDHRWTTLIGVREWLLVAEPFLPEELVADKHAKSCTIDKIAVEDVVMAAMTLVRG